MAGSLPSLHHQLLELAERLERAGLSEASRQLTRTVSTFERRTLRALVLGRFSVGKSTLINAFLGYPVLPGGLAPTTGAICRLAFGQPGATVRFIDGRVEEFSGPESLAPYVALGAGRGSSRSMTPISRVDVSLPLPLLKDGLEIVDSPGLDEHVDRTEIAEGGLESADIILFVLAADQLLGEIERRFFLEQVLPRSPGAVAVVVNFWDRIPEREQPLLRERMQHFLGGLDQNVGGSAAQFVGDSEPHPSEIPVFYLSAAQALRARWKKKAEVSGSGIQTLEEWLANLAASGEQVRNRALQGRVEYALRQTLLEIQHAKTRTEESLREFNRAAGQARRQQERTAKDLQRILEALPTSADSIRQGLSLRLASGEAALRAGLQRRLEKNPFDTLASLRKEIDVWWLGICQSTQTDAASLLVNIAGSLSDTGVRAQELNLPTLKLAAAAPSPDLQSSGDSSAPVRDTIAGFLGSVSPAAADTASTWFTKASRAAAGLDPQVRRRMERDTENLEAAVTLAAYTIREEVKTWMDELSTVVTAVVESQRSRMEEAALRAGRTLRESETRLRILSELQEEVESIHS